jgi:hypothetical protein
MPEIKKSILLEQILIEKSNIGKDIISKKGITELDTEDSIDFSK